MSLPATSAPSYSQRRIGTLNALRVPLGLSVDELRLLANRADSLYRVAKSITKPDGSIRNTYDALAPLKNVHRRIKSQILDHVDYPAYLTGSIKGSDYKVNAALHINARIVINEDISGFFPSTSAERVFNIWHGLFGFSQDVSQCLTLLTTRQGELPQGAITSSFLANLVFWQDEPTLHARLASQGLIYSRYVDDIAVSSKTFLTNQEKSEVVRQIYGMLLKHGYQPKRAKHEISTSGTRMEVTKLSINAKPGLGKAVYGKTRAAVHDIEQRIANGEVLSFERGPYAQAMGRVLHLERFHPGKAAPLKKRLLALKEGAET
ncbi:TPA: RNA-directed DNA polymerase [Pseudomonas aeruginosa]|uniref:reverse transcriptase family protein n=1 Tax=Pseudomonas aeruginosa TaxID=287 RepID=UPI00157B84D9|nr:reverse transcriptase family protein [Pseudomonas aeruginosa]MDP5424401.1 reverse transcriptase family protein [Pseudomonas aeruginosa]HBO2483050.1 RNA-directed DNA polymerase [Pseudomonas aeruginosa]HBP6616141.1 RNA-directed DNA polymerase [Pseudomonas aeruginosa]HCK7375955.1 RNA-directed DNA polymerase [Pseudomonas aeruginosa]HDV4085065.1 RNA-directed DNA polymerase [Pseudomonas aeruginosa]